MSPLTSPRTHQCREEDTLLEIFTCGVVHTVKKEINGTSSHLCSRIAWISLYRQRHISFYKFFRTYPLMSVLSFLYLNTVNSTFPQVLIYSHLYRNTDSYRRTIFKLLTTGHDRCLISRFALKYSGIGISMTCPSDLESYTQYDKRIIIWFTKSHAEVLCFEIVIRALYMWKVWKSSLWSKCWPWSQHDRQ